MRKDLERRSKSEREQKKTGNNDVTISSPKTNNVIVNCKRFHLNSEIPFTFSTPKVIIVIKRTSAEPT